MGPLSYGRLRLATVAMTTAATVVGCENTAVSPEHRKPLVVRAPAFSQHFSPWSAPTRADLIAGTDADFNTALNDGCPFVSPDGKTFYMASNRQGTKGGLDLWVSSRETESDGWSKPENVESVNTTADDFCPTIARDGHLLYFASRRTGGCGGSDLYVARLRADKGFDAPELLPCDATAPYESVNSPFDEWGPFQTEEPGSGPTLYFSSFRPGGFAEEAQGAAVDSDIYRSRSHGGVFGEIELVPEVNTTADDGQPNVSSDARELYFFSTRAIPGVSQGAADLYVATRANGIHAWGDAVNLGAQVNGAGADTRPSLSWDGTTLYFGSVRPGGKGLTDIYVTTRTRLSGGWH